MTPLYMRHATSCAAVLVTATLVAGCTATIAPETQSLLKKPVDCSTAQADLKRLAAAKPDGWKQTMTLAQSVSPVGLVVGLATEDLDNRKRVISGEHGTDIDRRIAQIASECGIKIEPPATSAPQASKRVTKSDEPSWAKEALQTSP